MGMEWIDVNDALPESRQAVLVRYADDNWLLSHTTAGKPQLRWRWQACYFERGRTKEELERSGGPIHAEDEWGNNLRPYRWKQFGPGSLFGQEVTHWAAITDPVIAVQMMGLDHVRC